LEKEKLIELLNSMNLEEKLGQLTQITGENYVGRIDDEMVETGPGFSNALLENDNLYKIGSVIGVSSAKITNMIQAAYLEKSRLKIPLLFMHDAIHGYKTIFPIPLALSCSWDEELVQTVAEHTASELRAAGINVNFSPMVDLVRDPRWGRVMESFGEDHILSGELGRAMVKGYQKNEDGKLSQNGVAACLKHFAAYGAAIGGKDYNTVDMSMREFMDYYGKPYEITLKEKPKFVMSSFNTFNGVPVTASEEMMQDILREKYQFENLVISDWGAVAELQNHRVAANGKEAAELSLNAGIDIEMCSTHFFENGREIVNENPELMEVINKSVMKILELKSEMGLFDNPYVDESLEDEVLMNQEFIQYSKESAKKSCVLLKNDKEVLPIQSEYKKILVVGPFAKTNELLGNWKCKGRFEDVVSLENGMKNLRPDVEISAYETLADCPHDVLESSEYILVAVGENWELSGEGHSSVHIELEESQKTLIKDVKNTGKPYACVFFSGRPLALQSIIDDIPALLWCWFPGTQAGNAVAELIFGDDTPSGKLTMSFPRYSAQAPIYYNEYNTGRPANDSSYSSRYQDCEAGPLFSFGHGLTYTKANYSGFNISSNVITENEGIKLTFEVENPSKYEHTEIAILFIEDLVSKICRPIREMKKYQVVNVSSGQTKTIEFEITLEDLTYLDNSLRSQIERGEFNIYVNSMKEPIASIVY
jgi:beta-glucosidase